ncbi:MAG: hypothetical protein M5R41_10460 [Bacteroidia bacterium]|nr:hypothetical protein [Bacteroidia bacterium]
MAERRIVINITLGMVVTFQDNNLDGSANAMLERGDMDGSIREEIMRLAEGIGDGYGMDTFNYEVLRVSVANAPDVEAQAFLKDALYMRRAGELLANYDFGSLADLMSEENGITAFINHPANIEDRDELQQCYAEHRDLMSRLGDHFAQQNPLFNKVPITKEQFFNLFADNDAISDDLLEGMWERHPYKLLEGGSES